MSSNETWFVFDVESVGLYGEGFAVAWVVVNGAGERLEEGLAWCSPDLAEGTNKDRTWVAQNVLHHLVGEPTHNSPKGVRSTFWHAWADWHAKGAQAAADVPCPVEANFIAACVRDAPATRTWVGPYPLYDIASVMFAAGLNPLGNYPRIGDENPPHHPLADARQSARLLVETLRALHSPPVVLPLDEDLIDPTPGDEAYVDVEGEPDDWQREQAMELGMGLGVEAYNDAMGWSTDPPEEYEP